MKSKSNAIIFITIKIVTNILNLLLLRYSSTTRYVFYNCNYEKIGNKLILKKLFNCFIFRWL